jgi:hypothetical protein
VSSSRSLAADTEQSVAADEDRLGGGMKQGCVHSSLEGAGDPNQTMAPKPSNSAVNALGLSQDTGFLVMCPVLLSGH